MIRGLVLLLFVFLCVGNTNACCGAGQYRIFPLGVVKQKAVCAVFELSRDCRNEEFFDHQWLGKVSLAFQEKDSLQVIRIVSPSVQFRECLCNSEELEQKSDYLKYMQVYLDSALLMAYELKGFKAFDRMDYITTVNNYEAMNIRMSGDTLRCDEDLFVLPVNEIGRCESLSMIREVRIYFFENERWIVCAMGCPEGKPINENLHLKGLENAKNLRSGMTYVSVDWHGYTKDVVLGP